MGRVPGQHRAGEIVETRRTGLATPRNPTGAGEGFYAGAASSIGLPRHCWRSTGLSACRNAVYVSGTDDGNSAGSIQPCAFADRDAPPLSPTREGLLSHAAGSETPHDLHCPPGLSAHVAPRCRAPRLQRRRLQAARGRQNVEGDLIAALRAGGIAGAALDVVAKEPPTSPPLWTMPGVLIMSHFGSETRCCGTPLPGWAAA